MKRIATLLCSVCCSFGIISVSAAQESAPMPEKKEQFHIYLLMGESNMAGRDTREMPEPPENPRILSLDAKGQWVMAADPLQPIRGSKGAGVGPGIPFALTMLEDQPEITIGLVSCTEGGAPINNWAKGQALYEKSLQRARLAAEAGVIRGIIWHHGESDSGSRHDAETYAERVAGMLTDFRTDLGSPDLPIVIGQPAKFLQGKKFPAVKTIQKEVRSLPKLLKSVALVSSSTAKHMGDYRHFDANSQRKLGRNYAKEMLDLQ